MTNGESFGTPTIDILPSYSSYYDYCTIKMSTAILLNRTYTALLPIYDKFLNNKLRQQGTFWHCHETGLVKTIIALLLNLIYEFQIVVPLIWVKTNPVLS